MECVAQVETCGKCVYAEQCPDQHMCCPWARVCMPVTNFPYDWQVNLHLTSRHYLIKVRIDPFVSKRVGCLFGFVRVQMLKK